MGSFMNNQVIHFLQLNAYLPLWFICTFCTILYKDFQRTHTKTGISHYCYFCTYFSFPFQRSIGPSLLLLLTLLNQNSTTSQNSELYDAYLFGINICIKPADCHRL
jgi:hypothetical protein